MKQKQADRMKAAAVQTRKEGIITMKKALLMVLTTIGLAALAGCGVVSHAETNNVSMEDAQEEGGQQETEAGDTAIGGGSASGEDQDASAADSRILIAYFSRWGNTDYEENVDATSSASIVSDGSEQYGTTEYVAYMIQELTGGELHLIQSEEAYPTDFNAVVSQNHEEMGQGTLPELKSTDLDMTKYDVVFVGYPVWASDAPQAVQSFLRSYSLEGKIVIPFCTHDGYGAGSSYSTVAAASAGAEVLTGIAIEAEDVPGARSTVQQWVDGLKLAERTAASDNGAVSSQETAIKITIGDRVLDGVLYDNAEARQFIAMLPQTVSMVGFGGREFYGGIDGRIQTEGEGRYSFEDGHITYCPANNTAAIFYAQTSRPNLTMEVFPMGKVTSDLSVFDELPGNVEITFSLAE